MKNFDNGSWPSQFSFDGLENNANLQEAQELLDDSYEALNKFYQKATKRSKVPKKRKHAWQ